MALSLMLTPPQNTTNGSMIRTSGRIASSAGLKNRKPVLVQGRHCFSRWFAGTTSLDPWIVGSDDIQPIGGLFSEPCARGRPRPGVQLRFAVLAVDGQYLEAVSPDPLVQQFRAGCDLDGHACGECGLSHPAGREPAALPRHGSGSAVDPLAMPDVGERNLEVSGVPGDWCRRGFCWRGAVAGPDERRLP